MRGLCIIIFLVPHYSKSIAVTKFFGFWDMRTAIFFNPFTHTTFWPLYSSQLFFLTLTTTCLAPLWLRQNLPGFFSRQLLNLYSTCFKMKLICGLFAISFFLFCINCDAKTLTNQNIIELCPTKVPKVNGTFKHELTTLRQAIEEVGSRSELR